jgi:hypothetical protein
MTSTSREALARHLRVQVSKLFRTINTYRDKQMYAINTFYFRTALTAVNIATSHQWHLRMSSTIEPSSTSKTDMHLKGSVGEETVEYFA